MKVIRHRGEWYCSSILHRSFPSLFLPADQIAPKLLILCFVSMRSSFCFFFLPLLPLSISFGAGQRHTFDEKDVIILVARGQDPNISENRVIIPQSWLTRGEIPFKYSNSAKKGQQPPLPCLISGAGLFEHEQTFTRGNFHYKCKNGTAEVIGTVWEERG